MRHISFLKRRCDDNSRLLMMIQEQDIPSIKRLAVIHFRNGFAVSSFMDKCMRAADHKMVGHATYQRGYVQRGTIRNGVLDAETFKILLLTILMNKLGCNKLLHTFNYSHGGMSHRQMQRHTNQLGTVPNFKILLTSCIDEQGMRAIEKNMENVFLNPHFLSFLPKETCLGIVVIDGVATEEKLNLDDSQESYQVTGLCRHCVSTSFNTFKDAQDIQEKLDEG